MQNYEEEIERLDREIAESDRAADTSEVLRQTRERFRVAEAAEQEARQRAAEKAAAAQAVDEAEAAVRRAEVGPLRDALGACDPQLADLEREINASLREAVDVARGFHARYLAIVHRRNDLAARLAALGDHPGHVQVLDFQAYVPTRLRRFDVRTASGAVWAREEDGR